MAEEIVGHGAGFAALLRDAVEHGASIGFVLPLPEAEVSAYWQKVAAEAGAGARLVVAAWAEDGRLAGSVQVALESRANGRHRAEVQKLMVLASDRGRGIGSELMRRAEKEAAARGRRLLFLDTSEGEAGARRFYKRLGYVYVGGIPEYAADPDGTYSANAIFYKRLG